jgi:hypothetical protein
MIRNMTAGEQRGFRMAVELLTDEITWLAWADQRPEHPVSREQRLMVADFLGVVGLGEATGTVAEKRRLIGDGAGWAAPSTAGEVSDPDTVWHAIVRDGEDLDPACGSGEIQVGYAVTVGGLSEQRWCAKQACQQRLVQA